MKKLKIKFGTLLTKASDATATRYALSGVQVVPHAEFPDECFASATDSRILAVTRMKGEVQGTHLVPATVLPKNAAETDGETVLHGKQYEFTKQTRKGPEMRIGTELDGRFPKVEDVLPQVGPAGYPHVVSISLDPQLLLNLAQALGQNEDSRGVQLLVSLQADEEGQLPACQSCTEPLICLANGNVGLIMPLVCEKPAQLVSAISQYQEFRQSFIEAQQAARGEVILNTATAVENTGEQQADADSDTGRLIALLPLVADSIDRLRQGDVLRFLEAAAQQDLLEQAALWIITERPDLQAEVCACVEDMAASNESALEVATITIEPPSVDNTGHERVLDDVVGSTSAPSFDHVPDDSSSVDLPFDLDELLADCNLVAVN